MAFLCCFTLCFTLSVSAQGIISFSSGTLQGSSAEITFIAGEAVSGTFSNENISLITGSGSFTDQMPVSIENTEQELPGNFRLSQNYPNPFNPVTVIEYQLPVSSDVRLDLFDMLGRRVAVLVNERMESGQHEVTLDASRLSSGLYLYRLTANGRIVDSKKMMLVK